MQHKTKVLILAIIVLASFLRLYQLTSVPPSLYWEEVAVGYDAYSLLQTGKDHHGAAWPIVAIKSFGDWKPTGYFYALLPSLALFGLTDFAVRLPNALAGIFTVIGIAVLSKKFGLSPIWSLFVAALSPWALQFSRSMWEANFATTLLVWGIIFAIKTQKVTIHKSKVWLLYAVLSGLLFAMAGYTYHAARFIAPVLCFSSVIFCYLTHAANKRSKVSLGIILATCAVLFLPLFIKASDPELTHRLQETSIFSDASIVEKSNELREYHNFSLVSRIMYHRYVFFAQKIMENALSHFSFSYLFLTGDENIRHSTKVVGLLYLFECVFLFVGVTTVWQKNKKVSIFLLTWLFITLVPAAITRAVPHALRTVPALPVFILYTTAGITTVISFAKSKKTSTIAITVILCMYFISAYSYLRYYYLVYPLQSATEWQFGYKEMVSKVVALEEQYSNTPVYITRSEGRPAMYYWFYTKTSPNEVQEQARTVAMDQGEFLSFQNKHFFRESPQLKETSIVVAAPEEVGEIETKNDGFSLRKIDSVSSLTGTIVWQLFLAEKNE